VTAGPGMKFDHLLRNMKAKIEPNDENEGSRVNTLESSVMSIESTVMMEAIREANRKPKLGVYSPLAAAILRYKAITIPRYSMGAELRTIIEKALKEAYPDLYEEVQRKMNSEQP
jgi:hypothetical protein